MTIRFGQDYVCPTCKGTGRVLSGKLECGVCHGTGIKRNPDEPRFDGETYDPERDRARLSGALLRIREAMGDGRWWTIPRLAELAGCTEAAASARIRDLRKRRFGGHTVERRNVGGGRWEYRLRQVPTETGEPD